MGIFLGVAASSCELQKAGCNDLVKVISSGGLSSLCHGVLLKCLPPGQSYGAILSSLFRKGKLGLELGSSGRAPASKCKALSSNSSNHQ
jgi:hypothetical protein